MNDVEAPVEDLARLWYYPDEGVGTHGLICIAFQVMADFSSCYALFDLLVDKSLV